MTRDGSSRKSRSGSAQSVLFWTSRCLAELSRVKWSYGSTKLLLGIGRIQNLEGAKRGPQEGQPHGKHEEAVPRCMRMTLLRHPDLHDAASNQREGYSGHSWPRI
jgi:hypothetical protein